MRLKSKLILAFLVLSLIPLIGSLTLSLWHSSKQAHKLSIQTAQATVDTAAEQINAYFKSRTSELAVIAHSPLVQTMNFVKMRDYLLQERDRFAGVYEKFIVGKLNGNFYNTSGGNPYKEMLRTFNDKYPNAKLKSISKRDYWQNTVQNNRNSEHRVFISDPMISYTTGVRQIVVAASILTKENKLVGMIGGAIPWKEIQNLVQFVREKTLARYNNQVKFMLVSSRGIYMYHWDKDKIIQLKTDKNNKFVVNDIGEKVSVKLKITDERNTQLKSAGLKMIQGQSGHLTYIETGTQVENVLIFSPISSAKYSVAVVVPKSLIMAPVRELKNILYSILIAALGLIVIVSITFSHKISTPIISLSNAAKTIGSGNFDIDLKISGNDEIAKLAQSFDLMRKQVENREAELESRVLERTEQLEYTKRKAERANDSKSLFLANMSHEIRTPMNGIIGTLDLLSRGKLTKEQLKLVTIANRSGHHLLSIINDILDISKHDAGKISLEIIEFNLSQCLADIYSVFVIRAEEKGIILNHNVEGSSPIWIKSDRTRIYQVLVNIIGNAIKFTQHGEVNLTVQAVNKIQNRTTLHFDISDTGIGIKRENIDSIFNTFEQEDSSTTRKFGGTGLGLALSQRLVHLLGGNLQVESNYGKGSRFFFALDVERVNRELNPRDDKLHLKEHTLSGRILLVEDDPVNQMVTGAMLNNLGLESDIAINGEEAIQLWSHNQYDLILMDMHMPIMDGITATKKIRELDNGENKVCIVALTANVLQEDIRKCFDAGMNDYLSKPLEIDTLSEMLSKWLAEHKKHKNVNI